MNIEIFCKKQTNKQTNKHTKKKKTKQKSWYKDNMNKHVHTVLLVKPPSHPVAFSFSSK